MEQGPTVRPPGISSPTDDLRLSEDQSITPNSSRQSQWPQCVRDFTPNLLSEIETIKEMMEIEKSFSRHTSVKVLARLPDRSAGLQAMVLDDQNLLEFRELSKQTELLACFVNRFIIRPGASEIPRDKKRLRISGATFRWLLTYFDASPCFVSSMLGGDIHVGLGSRSLVDRKGAPVYTCWYTLPVRTAAGCFDEEGNHALSVAGSNQMNPNGYIHLGDITRDIRPSKIGVYCRYDSKSCRMICIDFQDGRLHELAEEPFKRVREAIQCSRTAGSIQEPLDVHVVLLSSSARWWSHALSQLKRQLVHYEMRLLDESMQRVESSGPDLESSGRHLSMKKILHALVSHLQRYKTELKATKKITLDLQTIASNIKNTTKPHPTEEATRSATPMNEDLNLLMKQFSALEAFEQELEKKTGTVLELLSQVVTWRNDMLLINGGNLVGKLLASARTQAKAAQGMMRESHQMARDMRKDSVSMKAIALLTLAFLPATSFAAVLSMPFFNQQKWLDDPTRIWLWVVLAAPTTALSILTYMFFTRKELKSHKKSSQQNEGEEMDSVDLILG